MTKNKGKRDGILVLDEFCGIIPPDKLVSPKQYVPDGYEYLGYVEIRNGESYPVIKEVKQ